ncbi:MAG TPA: hypothetical protein VE195_00075, partial [Acidobacteriaceae bacterium]|nr:hypothetical protein [Acidobacteriaceae bacterium]
RGAVQVDRGAAQNSLPSELLEVTWTANNIADLRRMDDLALRQLPAADAIRRRWLEQAPGYFHRQRPLQRVLGMHPDEVMRLTEEFRRAHSAGEIQSKPALAWATIDGSKQSIATAKSLRKS